MTFCFYAGTEGETSGSKNLNVDFFLKFCNVKRVLQMAEFYLF